MKQVKKLLRKIFGGSISHWWRSFWDYNALRKSLMIKQKEQKQFPKKVAILFIGTNKYISFFPRYYETFKKYFLPHTEKDFFVFTDRPEYDSLKNKKDVRVIKIKHRKFPFINMLKFKFINKAKNKLKEYSQIVYIDADMYACSLMLEKDFFNHEKSLFAVQHYNFVKRSAWDELEHNVKSEACVKKDEDFSIYWQACFWGGKSKEFLQAIDEMEKRTDKDIKKNIIAKWWDESFLNKYLIENKKNVFTVDPSYSWTQQKPIPFGFKKKIIHVDENPPELKGKALKKEIRGTRVD